MASSSDLNLAVDVVIPAVFVITLFVINGFVLRFIMRKRRQYQDLPQLEATVDPTAPSTSGLAANAPGAVAVNDNDDSCAIEMERL